MTSRRYTDRRPVPESLTFSDRSTSGHQFNDLTPIEDLTLMIQLGWGNTPQQKLPNDWRKRNGPDKWMGR